MSAPIQGQPGDQTPSIPKPRRRFRRTRRALWVCAILGLGARASLPLWLPSFAKMLGERAGLALQYRDLDLNLLGCSFEIWGLEADLLEPVAGEDERLVRIDYAAFDLDVSALLGGDLVLHRAEIGQASVFARRRVDGSWQAADLLGNGSGAESELGQPAEEDAAKPKPSAPGPVDLTLPISIERLGITALHVHLEDEFRNQSRRLDFSLALTDFGGAPKAPDDESHDGDGALRVELSIPGMLTALRIDGSVGQRMLTAEAGAEGVELEASLTLRVLGLSPKAIEPWSAELGIAGLAHHVEARFDLDLELAPGEGIGDLVLDVAMADAYWDVDGVRAAELGEVRGAVQIRNGAAVDHGRIGVDPIVVRGVRAEATLLESGNLGALGFALIASDGDADGDTDTVVAAASVVVDESTSTDPVDLDAQRSIQFGGVHVADCGARFEDRLAGTDLQLGLDSLDIGPFQIGGPGANASSFSLALSAPGIFTKATLIGAVGLGLGTNVSGERSNGATLSLRVEELNPVALEPYLKAAGVERIVESGELTAQLDAWATAVEGGTDVRLSLSEIAFVEHVDPVEPGAGATLTLAALGAIGIEGMHIDADTGAISIQKAFVTGPKLDALKQADGSLEVAGFRIRSQVPGHAAGADDASLVEDQSPSASPAPSATSSSSSSSYFRLESLELTGTELSFRDAGKPLAQPWSPERLDLSLTGFEMGASPGELEPKLGEGRRAHLELQLEMAGTVDSLALNGEFELASNGVDADLTLAATGLAYARLAPYLEAAGIQGELERGSARGRLTASLTDAEDADQVLAILLEGWHFSTDQQVELLALEKLAVPRVLLPGQAGRAIALGPIQLDGVRLLAERDLEGRVGALGLRFGGAVQETATDIPVDAGISGALPGTVDAIGQVEEPPSTPLLLESAGIEVTGVEVKWFDQAVQPAVDTSLRLGASVGPFRIAGPDGGHQPLALNVQLALDGMLESLSLALVATPDPSAPTAKGQLLLSGIRGESLGPYLPPGIRSTLESGTLALPFDFSLRTEDVQTASGELDLEIATTSIDAELGPLTVADGGVELMNIERIALHSSGISRAGLAVEELALTGVRLDVEKAADGGLGLPGFSVAPAPEQPAAGPEVIAGAVPQAQKPAPAPAAVPFFLTLPSFHLGQLELEVEHLGFQDLSMPGSTPLDLQLSLHTKQPWSRDLHAEDEDEDESDESLEYAPLELELTGHALPVAGAIHATAALKPFGIDPELHLEWLLGGLSGAGLLEMIPTLAESLDTTELDGGTFEGKGNAILNIRRRGPLDFDFEAGLGGQFELRDVAFRAIEGQRVLLGFDALAAELTSHSPRAGRTHFSSIELERPVGFVKLEEGGTRVLGVLLKPRLEPVQISAEVDSEPAPELESPAPELADAEMASDGATVAAESPVNKANKANYELVVDRIFITGADLELRDESVTPPMVLPLDDLDVVVSGFSTRAMTRALPIRLELFAEAGEVELRARDEGDNLLLGVLGAAADLVRLSGNDFETEPRRVFNTLVGSGNVTLFPELAGWVQLELLGLELPNFRGQVMDSGVDIGDGLVDLGVDLRFLGKRGTSVQASLTAAHLSLSEPPGGPISTYLKLPAPLDTVLFLLRNEDGEQELDLNFRIGDEGVEGIGSAIAKTLGIIIGEAIASSPMRLVDGVLDLTGLFKEDPLELPEEVHSVAFLAGATESLELGGLLEYVEPVLELLRADRTVTIDLTHSFGSGDLERLEALANPAPEDCIQISTSLRQERDELRAKRDQVAVELRTAFALGERERAQDLIWTLGNLDDDIGRLEDTIDGILEFLRPGAERSTERRTKAAALLLAELRLEAVREAISSLPIPSILSRIRVRRPRLSEPAFDGGGRVAVVPSR